jgi:hypothetical protein
VSKIKKFITGAGVAIFAIIALFVGMYDVASDSIQFDLRIIGESIYEAHAKSGNGPRRLRISKERPTCVCPTAKMGWRRGPTS